MDKRSTSTSWLAMLVAGGLGIAALWFVFGIYTAGQCLFDARDPRRLIGRTDTWFLRPDRSHEVTGQYVAGTTFIEGLVRHSGRWLLYYGAADSYVGVAVCDRILAI